MNEDVVGLKPEDLIDSQNPEDPFGQKPKASAGPVGSQRAPDPTDPSTFLNTGQYAHYPTTPGQAPGSRNFLGTPDQRPSVPLTGQGTPPSPYSFNPEDWLGFSQQTSGGQHVSRGGSQGGFVTGGGAYRGKLQSVVDAFNKKFGAKATVAGDDKIDFGDGKGPQDVITSGGDFWYGGPMGTSSTGAGAGGGGATGGAGATSPTAGFGGQDDAIHQAIMALLGRGSTPLSANDPMLQQQFAPISRTLQRGAQRTREASAERLAQQGLNSGGKGGALDADVNAINESLGEQEGAAMGKLTTAELAARRADVVNALRLAQGEQHMALQKQLAQIDAELRRQALSQQNAQFYDVFARDLGHEANTSDSNFVDYLTR